MFNSPKTENKNKESIIVLQSARIFFSNLEMDFSKFQKSVNEHILLRLSEY